MDELDQLWPLGVGADLFLNKVSACRVQQIARRCVCFVLFVLFCFVCFVVVVAGLVVCFVLFCVVLFCLFIMFACFVLFVWLVGWLVGWLFMVVCLWLLLCVAILDVCGQVVQRDSTRSSFVRQHLCWCAAPLGILDKADGAGPWAG